MYRSTGWGIALVMGSALGACAPASSPAGGAMPVGSAAAAFEAPGSGVHTNLEQVVRGRALVIQHDCGGCHGGGSNPADPTWLSGTRGPTDEFRIGACQLDPAAKPCFITRPRNLTPDNLTGLGHFSERQIFNALRYGLRPGETPDVTITSRVPGQGNFPQNPKYLAPPMPWMAWRQMNDADLWAIAAYLKHGLKPVHNQVADSEGPPDFWASAYTDDQVGSYPAAAFPTANEEYRP
jgi:mono/diheme cytochrome c family protein